MMEATLQLNLADALSAEELRCLTEIAAREGKTIERVLFEAAKAVAENVVAMAPNTRRTI